MQAKQNDRLTNTAGRRGGSPVLVTAAALFIVAGIAWLLLGPDDAPPEEPATMVVPQTPDPTPPRVAEPVAPDIPERPVPAEPEPATGEADDEPAPEPEPPAEPEEPPLSLDNSDPVVRDALAPYAARGLPAQLLGHSNLLERGVAAMDAVRRGVVPTKVFNLPKPRGDFRVHEVDGRTVIDPMSYRRYDGVVDAIVATPVEPLATAFQDYRSLLETAYGALGYAPNKVDNALVAALDRIIALPVPEGDIEVMKVEAIYAYVDEDLEGLKPLDKQLLRTGPDNLRRLQDHARELRRALLEP
ncbi:DUF3014 domain-containing protein [Pseudohaliea rubra]|uniref:DUF3014 domain-containing protein n=1 Tax=Pseudohaliea rubra DSM 19751 TaxID=1265313 RepID=A0A095X2G9_9GAMM|nr:DUF3014 domain-containing protein [Pseudohaliea rubra]KGE05054.1 hypothetical protein HRUBRA_00256 [Pseudohaliea rubra DSM 19751]